MNKHNKTTISVSKDTKNKLSDLKIIPEEPLDAVINRILDNLKNSACKINKPDPLNSKLNL